MNQERRATPRTHSQLTFDLCDPKGHAVTGEARVVNLSASGVLLETPKPLRVKERLRLRYQPGKKPVLDVPAKVIWVSPYRRQFRYGLAFDRAVAVA